MEGKRNRFKTGHNATHIKHPIPILFGRYEHVKENINRH